MKPTLCRCITHNLYIAIPTIDLVSYEAFRIASKATFRPNFPLSEDCDHFCINANEALNYSSTASPLFGTSQVPIQIWPIERAHFTTARSQPIAHNFRRINSFFLGRIPLQPSRNQSQTPQFIKSTPLKAQSCLSQPSLILQSRRTT